ncbi:MAG: ATP-binding cassette domain-containing protein [Armatimonadota bacterium]
MIAVDLSIVFNNVNAGYRGGITLSIELGRIIGVSSPNGSGKTTLSRVIQGMLPVRSGSVNVLGFDLLARHYKEIRRIAAKPALIC